MSLITAANINSFGLGLDIIGVWLLFRFGLAADVYRGSLPNMVLEADDDSERKRAKFYGAMSYLGLGSLILGFVLQIFSNHL